MSLCSMSLIEDLRLMALCLYADDLGGVVHGARKLLGRAAPPPPAPASGPPFSASIALPPPPLPATI